MKSLRKRGQIVGQVFIFIIGAFVIGAIVLLGYRGIKTIDEQRCTAQEVSFVTDLKEALNNNLARGKLRTISVQTPCDADEVCFISRSIVDDPTNSGLPAPNDQNYRLIQNSLTSGEVTNVFIGTSEGYEPVTTFNPPAPIADIKDISSGNMIGIICLTAKGEVNLRLEGDGRTVSVGAPS